MYPLELHAPMLSLLERFEIVFPIHKLGTSHDELKKEEASMQSLVPSMLPEQRPSELLQLWPSDIRTRENVFGRTYSFEFVQGTRTPFASLKRSIVLLQHA
jgi:hypothetical protein